MTYVWIITTLGLAGLCGYSATGASYCYTAVPGQVLYQFSFQVKRVESWYGSDCWEGSQRIKRGHIVTKSPRAMKRCN